MFDLDFRLAPEASAPAAARRALEGLKPSVGKAVAEVAALLLSEVVTNAVRHAGLTEHDTILVRIRLLPDVLRIDISDSGPGFDPDLERPAGEGGWGLRLVDKLSSRWGVLRGPLTTTWFEVKRE